jgi:hypothetical protein
MRARSVLVWNLGQPTVLSKLGIPAYAIRSGTVRILQRTVKSLTDFIPAKLAATPKPSALRRSHASLQPLLDTRQERVLLPAEHPLRPHPIALLDTLQEQRAHSRGVPTMDSPEPDDRAWGDYDCGNGGCRGTERERGQRGESRGRHHLRALVAGVRGMCAGKPLAARTPVRDLRGRRRCGHRRASSSSRHRLSSRVSRRRVEGEFPVLRIGARWLEVSLSRNVDGSPSGAEVTADTRMHFASRVKPTTPLPPARPDSSKQDAEESSCA